MKRRLTFFIITMLIITLLIPTVLIIPASAAYNNEIDFQSEIVYMENLDNNTVIFNKNSSKRTPMASLTKITTALVVLDHCDNLDEKVTVSASALAVLKGTNSSTAGTKVGEVLTVRELLYLLLVRSANEASCILAEHIAGDIPSFVDMMNDFASSLGLKNTHYVNTHGLDADGHYTTAEDLATIIKYALQNETFCEIVSSPTYTQKETNKRKETIYTNTNNLLISNSSYYYEPCKGIKTGSTDNAGHCLASYATKNGYTYLCIIIGAPYELLNEDATIKTNFAFRETKQAYEWVFSNIKLKNICTTTDVVDVVDVDLARKTDHVRLVPASDVSTLMPANVDTSLLEIKTVPGSVPTDLKAPIKAGEVLGQAEIKYAGDTIETIDLVAGEDVARSASAALKYGIKNFFTSKFMRVIYIAIALLILIILGLRYYNKNIRKSKKYRVVKTNTPIRTTTGFSKKYKRTTGFKNLNNKKRRR